MHSVQCHSHPTARTQRKWFDDVVNFHTRKFSSKMLNYLLGFVAQRQNGSIKTLLTKMA
jgi:hypothetical protein